MKNNFEGYLNLFGDLLASTKENENIFATSSHVLCFIPPKDLARIIRNLPSIKSCLYNSNFASDFENIPLISSNIGMYSKSIGKILSEAKTSFDYSKFSSYEIGESVRKHTIQDLQNQLNVLEALSDLHNALIQIAEDVFLNFYNTLNTLMEFLKKVRNYEDSQIETYKIYGLACEVLRATTALFNLNNSGIDKKVEETLINAFGKSECFDINGENLFLLLIRKQLKLIDELFSCDELLVVIRCAEKIVQTDVLPEKLRYKEAADSIVDYFANRRVSNEKEAINLYFQELASKKAADKAFAEEQRAKEEVNKEIMSIIMMIEDNISKQNSNATLVASAFNEIQKEHIKDYNHLVDEHNILVNKHNALVDEIKKKG